MNIKRMILGLSLLLVLLCAGCAEKKPDYSITLEPAQIESFQSATSHLLWRSSKDRYFVQYRDCGAVLQDGKLTTLYDGMGVALSAPDCTPIFPTLNLHGGQGELLQCTGSVVITTPEQQEPTSWLGLVQVDKPQKTATVLGMALRNESTEEQLLAGQHGQLPTFPLGTRTAFYAGTCYKSVYAEDGKLLPLNEWKSTSPIMGYEHYLSSDSTVGYLPLQGDSYYLIYEITDTNGRVYCSDPIPYQAEKIPPIEDIRTPEYSVKWEKGAREQFLFSKNGLDIYLAVIKNTLTDSNAYTIKAKNNTDQTISVFASDLIVNGNIYCGSLSTVTVEPGKFVAGKSFVSDFSYGIADGAPELEQIHSLLLCVYARTGDGFSGRPIFDDTYVQIDMTDAWWVAKQYTDSFRLSQPGLGALAREQLLQENETLRLTLVNAGYVDGYRQTLRLVFKAENRTAYSQAVNISGLVVNGVFLDEGCSVTLPGYCTGYLYTDIDENDLAFMQTPSVETLQVALQLPPEASWQDPVIVYCPVTLEQAGTAENPEEKPLLWESEYGQVRLLRYDATSGRWWLSLHSRSDSNLCLKALDDATGTELSWPVSAAPGQTVVRRVDNPYAGRFVTEDTPYSIRLQLYEGTYGDLLAETQEPITLHTVTP